MLRKLLQITWSGIRRGHIYGIPVSRRPVDWIPFFAVLPLAAIVWFLLIVVYMLALPLVFIGSTFSLYRFRRKAGVFSDAGIYFPRAYGGAGFLGRISVKSCLNVTQSLCSIVFFAMVPKRRLGSMLWHSPKTTMLSSTQLPSAIFLFESTIGEMMPRTRPDQTILLMNSCSFVDSFAFAQSPLPSRLDRLSRRFPAHGIHPSGCRLCHGLAVRSIDSLAPAHSHLC